MMMNRRSFLAAAAAILALPRQATAQQPRYMLKGGLSQGELVTGKAEPGARAMLDGKPLRLSPDGSFAFGFSYNQKTRSVLVIRYADGLSDSRDITPMLRDRKAVFVVLVAKEGKSSELVYDLMSGERAKK